MIQPKKLALLSLGLFLFAFVLDAIAVKTGFPYGYFWYGLNIRPVLFGVPPHLVLGFPLVYLGACAVANRAKVPVGVPWMMFVAMVMTVVALVIEPVAVAKGLWIYRNGGEYFNVPVGVFVGTLFTGSLAAFIFPNELRSEKAVALLMLIVGVGAIEAVIRGLAIPAGVGLVICCVVAWFDLKRHGWKS